MIRCSVRTFGVLGPGLPDATTARSVLAGGRAWSHADIGRVVSPALPRAEARRATLATHLALCVADQALQGQMAPDASMPSVWAAADSDLGGLEKNCATLADDPPWISPHRFQNSVHNTPSGYWSIATGCHGPATALCAGDESFAAGLVEAATMLHAGNDRCLLVTCDELSPPSLTRVREVLFSFATALLLTDDAEGDGVPLTLECRPGQESAPTPCADAGLEGLRTANPAARALPLLCALARGEGAIDLPWSGGCVTLRVGRGA